MEIRAGHTHRVHKNNLTDKQKSACWEQIISDFKSSGMHQAKFAKQHGIKQDHLSYYYRKHMRAKSNSKLIEVSVQPPPMTLDMAIKVKIREHELLIPYSNYQEKLQIVRDLLCEQKC